MNEIGYVIKDNYRKVIDQTLLDEADLVVSFKPKDELPEFVHRHTNIRYWTVQDPQHMPIEFRRKVRDSIRLLVSDLIEEMAGRN